MWPHPMNRNRQGFLHFRPIFVLLDSIYCCLEVLLRRDGLLERTEASSEPSEARSRHIKANSGRDHTPDSEIDGNWAKNEGSLSILASYRAVFKTRQLLSYFIRSEGLPSYITVPSLGIDVLTIVLPEINKKLKFSNSWAQKWCVNRSGGPASMPRTIPVHRHLAVFFCSCLGAGIMRQWLEFFVCLAAVNIRSSGGFMPRKWHLYTFSRDRKYTTSPTSMPSSHLMRSTHPM